MSDSFDEKKYTLDGEPVSATELIQAAIELDQEFDDSGFHQTSVAAGILRENGHEVGTAQS